MVDVNPKVPLAHQELVRTYLQDLPNDPSAGMLSGGQRRLLAVVEARRSAFRQDAAFDCAEPPAPLSANGRLTGLVAARSTVATALELLTSLPQEAIQTLVQQLQAHLAALLAPLEWLEQTLAPYRQDLDPATETTILWAWQHRHALALPPGTGFPAHLQPTVQAF